MAKATDSSQCSWMNVPCGTTATPSTLLPASKLYFYYFGVTTEDGLTHVIHANESMRGELSVDTDRYWQLTVYDPKMKRPASLGNGILYRSS